MDDAEHGEAMLGSGISEADVDAVLAEFGGDARSAIRALLADIDALARDHVATVSFGFVRGELLRSRLRRPS